MRDEVGITIATHGWIGGEISGGKFMLEEGAEMQWKEEREVNYICSFRLQCDLLSYINVSLHNIQMFPRNITSTRMYKLRNHQNKE